VGQYLKFQDAPALPGPVLLLSTMSGGTVVICELFQVAPAEIPAPGPIPLTFTVPEMPKLKPDEYDVA
jgi:hypothetical protein